MQPRVLVILLTLVALTVGGGGHAAAEDDAGVPDLRLESWGVRLGLASDPDQPVAGVHFDLGELADRVYLEPSLELGAGDDHVVFAATAAAHYRFPAERGMVPYAGGGVSLGLNHHDRPRGDDDTDFEIALRGTGGLIWRLRSGNDVFVEVNLVFGDLHDLQAFFGWRF